MRYAISYGRVAEWLCSGLQIRVRRFNSDLGLQHDTPLRRGVLFPAFVPQAEGLPRDVDDMRPRRKR